MDTIWFYSLFSVFCKTFVLGTEFKFTPSVLSLNIDNEAFINYEIQNVTEDKAVYAIYSEDIKILEIQNGPIMVQVEPLQTSGGIFTVKARFLGRTKVSCRNVVTGETLNGNATVTVTRKERVIDTIFTVSVAVLISLIYINFGCAVNWNEFRQILQKPIGPVIGFFGQFIVMPLVSFGLAHLLFPDNPPMQLGMFFVGASPGGGASNLWTLLLDGNIGLSILMTTISTIMAFAMMPLWIFTLGRVIFENGKLEIPYTQILSYVIGLLIPLGLGYLCQRYAKKMAEFLKRVMKMFSTFLLVFIVGFAIMTNLYLFELFSWEIIIAGLALPWIGYLIGYLSSLILRQPANDRIAIAIEVGLQNTGIAIFLLRFTLPQPEADITTVLPVSIAMLSPLPLVIAYATKKIFARFGSKSKKTGDDI